MSDTVKLIIEIPTDFYEITKAKVDRNMISSLSAISIAHGIPLDDVKAEISEKSFNHYFEYGEYIGEDCRKERIIYSDKVIEILDNIGKGDS